MAINKSDIAELENQLIAAIKIGDIAFLDTVLHEDLLFLAPDGQLVTKEIDLASHRAGSMVVEKLIATVENITILRDTAVVVLLYDTKGTMLGNPVQGRFRYIRMWKQFSDSLKVIGGSCIKLPD